MNHKPSTSRFKKCLPAWAEELIQLYESHAASQFIIYGNVNDRLLIPLDEKEEIGGLPEFLMRVLLPRFDVVLSYDLGNGIRVEKGGDLFSQWPQLKASPDLPRAPRPAIETLTHYFRYAANLGRLGRDAFQVACIVRSADLVAPTLQGGLSYDLNALASLCRDWATDPLLTGHTFASFLLMENINDLHPLIATNPRAARIKVPLPSSFELGQALHALAPRYPGAVKEQGEHIEMMAHQLAGATLSAVESLLKTSAHANEPVVPTRLVTLKKQLVEKDCSGLIEFIESQRTLDDVHGLDNIKGWLRQDIALWKQNDLQAMPKGYLLCGPVGTGKTFLVECLAGEAGVPVVKLKNFRDKWVGSSEGNLERIFRLLQAVGRCYVFIDEADQALGKRESGTGDSGLSGRLYSMIAEEMSRAENRGRIVWILASSRPDLIEVDLKRPGRIDVKIPLFPAHTPAECYALLHSMFQRRDMSLPASPPHDLESCLPSLLTPGAAEALTVKAYRLVRTAGKDPVQALRDCLKDYLDPVPADVMRSQINLAVTEASDISFIPQIFRKS